MTSTDDPRPLLVVIATGPQQYREYLFASLHTAYRIHLLHTEAASWEQPYLVGADVVPDFGAATLTAAARRVHETTPVSGVLSWDEARILPAAHVADALGLPGGDPAAVERCRDKHLGRQAMARTGVRQPRSILVRDVDEATAAARELGYPVVLKPRAAAASYGVVRVDDEAGLRARFGFAHEATVPDAPRHPSTVLVEELVEGPEVSVDSVVVDGVVTPVFVAHKELGFPPYFEETGHLVAYPDLLLSDPELRRELTAAHAGLGLRYGWTHAEFILAAPGPTLVEVNGRLGGDLIPYLGMRAAGIDPGLLAAAAATGRAEPVRPTRSGVAGVRFCYPEAADTLVRSASFDEAALPATLDRAVPVVKPDSRVSPPPQGLVSGRVAFVTVLAGSADECREGLAQAQRALRLVTAPADTSAGVGAGAE